MKSIKGSFVTKLTENVFLCLPVSLRPLSLSQVEETGFFQEDQDQDASCSEMIFILIDYIFFGFHSQHTLRSVLLATKASNDLPAAGDDFDYYTSFQGVRDILDIEGKRILHV